MNYDCVVCVLRLMTLELDIFAILKHLKGFSL